MKFRTATVCALALFAVLQTSSTASAEIRILWPRIYVPHIIPQYDRYHDDEYQAYYDDEEEEIIVPRHRRKHYRDMVLEDYYDDEDLDPVYEPPVKRAVKPKQKKQQAVKKPAKAKTVESAATVVKPKAKTAPVTAARIDTSINAKPKAPASTALKSSPPVPGQVAVAKPQAPVSAAKPAPAPVKVASAATPAGAIGCSKGAEIVSGYGFTSVKPRACTGATYSFDATRSANAYLIKVSAATGEITDVQKLK